jgi:IS1 family transposase
MIPHHVYYQLAILGLLWLCLMLHAGWPSQSTASHPQPSEPIPSKCKRKRSNEPKAFEGLTHRPPCAACAPAAHHPQASPPRRPDPMPLTHRRPRVIDTSRHFCPHVGCDYRGWLGLNNLRANGHPSGGPWRQLQCTSCEGYFLETHGTILHGKRVAVELLVRVLACLAEGLGIRATARVFEIDPNTVLQWLVEAAEQLKAFSAYFLCDMHINQLQLDELYAVLRGVKEGEISAQQAIKRLERSRRWVWTAIDPESKLLLAIEIGPRTLAMAQRVVHHVVQTLVPSCVPLCLTDGYRDYTMAVLAHFGFWHQPSRQRAQGPAPKPRWMPLPALLYAQVVKSYRRRRLVDVKHRVVFGTREAIAQALAACGWTINTAFVERLNLDIRQRVAAIGRRVNTLCQGEDGVQHQLTVFQTYHNFVLPHSSLRQPLRVPEPTNGRGSAKRWRLCTPAMAAGLTDHVWTLQEVLMFRVPPWPQSQGQ